jgi:hypothetical protein
VAEAFESLRAGTQFEQLQFGIVVQFYRGSHEKGETFRVRRRADREAWRGRRLRRARRGRYV